MSLQISVNRKTQVVEEGTTIRDLIRERGFEPPQVVVVHNEQLLERDDVDRPVYAGDVLRILPMVAGG